MTERTISTVRRPIKQLQRRVANSPVSIQCNGSHRRESFQSGRFSISHRLWILHSRPFYPKGFYSTSHAGADPLTRLSVISRQTVQIPSQPSPQLRGLAGCFATMGSGGIGWKTSKTIRCLTLTPGIRYSACLWWRGNPHSLLRPILSRHG